MTAADATIAAWRTATESADEAAAIACLAPDVVLISPLTEAFRFHGAAQVGPALGVAFEVIEGIRFHTGVGEGDVRALFYRATVKGQAVEEAQLLRLDADGLIAEITFFGRPLPGVTAVMTALAAPLLRRQGRPVLGRVLAVATAPLAAFTKLGERRLVPLADPAKAKK